MTRRDSKRERRARTATFPEYEAMTLDQLVSERKSLGVRAEEVGDQLHALRLRIGHVKLRIRALRENDTGIGC